MKKYLISIEDLHSPRLKNLFEQATFLNKENEFKVFGTKGSELSVSEYFKQGVAGKVKAMTPGELGCTLSHLHALHDFLASNEAYAIIFEDDVIEKNRIDFDDLEQKINQLNLKENFFLSLGGIQMKICNKVRGQLLEKSLFDQKVLQVDLDFLDKLSYAYAYVVDRKMAQALIDYHTPARIYDHWKELSTQKNVHFYATCLFEHPILTQDNITTHSHLEQERALSQHTSKSKTPVSQYLKKKLKKLTLHQWS